MRSADNALGQGGLTNYNDKCQQWGKHTTRYVVGTLAEANSYFTLHTFIINHNLSIFCLLLCPPSKTSTVCLLFLLLNGLGLDVECLN